MSVMLSMTLYADGQDQDSLRISPDTSGLNAPSFTAPASSKNNGLFLRPDSSAQKTADLPRCTPGQFIASVAAADLSKTGLALGGMLIAMGVASKLVDTSGEWGGLALWPYALAGGAVGDLVGGTVAIHMMNRKRVNSHPLYATGGMLLHYAAGAGLISLKRTYKDQEVLFYLTYFTAPITGTAAYLLFGKARPDRKITKFQHSGFPISRE
jgi:hypothetical protein